MGTSTKGFLLLLLSIALQYAAVAQTNTGSIKGVILTADQQPAPAVTVILKGTRKTTITDEAGSFLFQRVQPGSYSLEIILSGYERSTTPVTVTENETANVSMELKLSEKQLKEVEVISGRNRFSRKESNYVSRLPIRNLENPQVYNVITKDLMKEQVIVNFDDALKNAPGVNKLWTATGRAGDGAGYFSMRGFAVQPKIVNGIAGATNGSPDPANIERIEVIKGPSGTLFGSSLVSFGGLINTVTKKPYRSFGAEASYTGGSFGLNRITADVNVPLDSAGNALFRTNAAYHYENSFQDAGFRKSLFFAPSLSYQATDRLSFLMNAEFFTSESTNPEMLFLVRTGALKVFRPQDMGINYKRSYTSNDITIKNPVVNVTGQITYKISDKWTSQTNLSRSQRKSDGYYSYLSVLPGDSTLNRIISDMNSTSVLSNIQQNFIGDFKLGSIRNRLVIGIDYLATETNNNNSPYVTFDTVSFKRPDPRYTNLTRPALDALIAATGNATKNSALTNTYSIYASDVVNITDRLLAMLSLRLDRFDNKGTYDFRKDTTTGNFAQTAWSPKFGLVYEIIKQQVSVFANYMNGFQNLAPSTQPDGTVRVFMPQQANQWEAGVKVELLGGKITGNLSYYDLYVTNVTRPDPEQAGFTIQDGNIASKGIEADIVANPFTGLNIVAGYGYNDSKNDKTDKNTIGRRPNAAGPQHLANWWVSYKLSKGSLHGLGIGLGGNYASENIITNNAVTGQFILPAYTVLNASVFFERSHFRIGLKLDNIADKEYWGGWTTIEPQLPRRFAANVALKL